MSLISRLGARFTASTRWAVGLGVAFLLIWILIVFWDVATLQRVNVQNDLFTSDQLYDRLPARAFTGSRYAEGALPLWNPAIYTGFPAFAQPENGSFLPSNVALFATLSPMVAMAFAQLLPLLLFGLGTLLLARRHGLRPAACLLAGGTAALSGFFICHLRQLNMLDTACWIPWLWLSCERLLGGRGARAWVELVLIWAVQLLAGHPEISVYNALVTQLYVAVRWFQLQPRTPGRRAWLWPWHYLRTRWPWLLAGALALGTLIAAIQLVPTAELTAQSRRSGAIAGETLARYAAQPSDLLGFVAPYAHGDPGQASYRGHAIFWEVYGYLGLLPLGLGLAGLVLARKRRVIWLLGGVAVFAALMMLGPSTPLHAAVRTIVPPLAFFRFPDRFLVFVTVALALLAGFGLDAVLERVRRPRLALTIAAAALALTAVDLWVHHRRQLPTVSRADWERTTETETWLRAALRRGEGRYYALESSAAHLDAYRRARGWSGDLTPYLEQRALLPPSANGLAGVDSPDGYTNLVPRYADPIWGGPGSRYGHMRSGGRRRAGGEGVQIDVDATLMSELRLFNVAYVGSRMRLQSSDLTEATTTAEGVHLYQVRDPLPRAFVVGAALSASSDEDALAVIESADFDPRQRAVIAAPAGDQPASAAIAALVAAAAEVSPAPVATTTFARHDATRISIEVTTDRPALLVLSEGYYPGWEATVDGTAAELVRANLMMRAVPVPAGTHVVDFAFHPRSLRLGAWLSLAGLLILFAAVPVARAILRRRAHGWRAGTLPVAAS